MTRIPLRTPARCLVLAALAACGASPQAPDPSQAPDPPQVAVETLPDLTGWHVARGEAGLRVAWRTQEGELLRNQDQELSVLLFFDGEAVPGAKLVVRGWMPDHGHGFVQTPHVVDEGGGAYRVEGLRLHMRGSWQLFFDVRTDALRESVLFELEV